jgi:polyisoprenyl-teichoic acid--peptidoglycan teichoic acid transferase
VPWEAVVSGSEQVRQAGFGLVVPALLLGCALAFLIVGALAIQPTVPARAERPPDLLDPLLDDELVSVVDLATPDPVFSPAIAEVRMPASTPIPAVVPTIAPTPTPTWAGPPTFTFVALGVDQRNDREIPRTDTIMLGQVDLRVPRVSLVSIPRDLLVDIPGYGKDRINTAYVYGEAFKEPGGGIGLLQRTIEKSFGVKVDHFGMLDFQCFRTAVDAVGGVTVNVPRAIIDPTYPTEDYGTQLVKFEPGLQRMDGERALQYARTRSSDNDFQRMQRQQLIVSAMRDQLLQLRTLPAIPTLLGGCRNLRSDLGWREYLNLAASMRTLDGKAVSFAAINETMVVDSVLPSGAAVLIPRWDQIRPLIGERFASGSAVPALDPAVSGMSSPRGSPAPLASPAPFGSPTTIASQKDVLPGDALTPAPLVTPRRT